MPNRSPGKGRFILPKLLTFTLLSCGPSAPSTDGGVADAGPVNCYGDGGLAACQACQQTCPSDGFCQAEPDGGYQCEVV